jgi:hydroxyacylglutathione hydrolase
MKLIVKRLGVGLLETNCYIVIDEVSRSCWVLDPGGDSSAIVASIEGQRAELKGILLTHAHFDHILGLYGLVQHYGEAVPIAASAASAKLLGTDGARIQRSTLMGIGLPQAALAGYREALDNLPEADILLFAAPVSEDSAVGEQVPGSPFIAYRTPGHSSDSLCFSAPEGILFSGDTLFRRSVGRTDLPGSSSSALAASIRQVIYTLPDETKVFPGHGEATTVGEEKRLNPFVRSEGSRL